LIGSLWRVQPSVARENTMPTLDDYWDVYKTYSKAVSDIARTLAYSAIAIAWVFKLETAKGDPSLPKALLWPLALAVVTLLLDFFQYLYLAVAWRLYARYLERRGRATNRDVDHPAWIPLPGEILFVSKVASIVACYCLLIRYLYGRLFP